MRGRRASRGLPGPARPLLRSILHSVGPSIGLRGLSGGLALAALTACSAPLSAAAQEGSTARPLDPRPGAAEIGDPYYPGIGNGGYDVQHYELALHLELPAGSIRGTCELRCRALHDLSSFNLDLFGLAVESVTVDGAPAGFEREGRELVVRPRLPIASGTEVLVRVAYAGVPELCPDRSVGFLPGVGWWQRESGVYVMSQVAGAATWFPCNDHPRDKATFGLTVSVPEPFVAASNGRLVSETAAEGRRTFVWRAEDPLATYLACLAVARFDVVESEGPRGLPLRLYHPTDATEEELAPFARTAEMLAAFEERFGPYPFESCGAVLSYEELGGALETQTLPTYSRHADEATIAHELAHQWFGNCVSVDTWRDIWLSEGFASYAEWLWREHEGGHEELERAARRSYRYLRRRRVGAPYDPGVEHLFSGRTYGRGAFVLHMLRRELGDETFFGALRSWVERFHDASADTRAFVEHCEARAGRELDAFFDAWLYGEVLPEVEEYEAAEPQEAVPGAGGGAREG